MRTPTMPKLPKGREMKITRSFMIEPSEWEKFKDAAEFNNATVSEALRVLIADYNRRTDRRRAAAEAARD